MHFFDFKFILQAIGWCPWRPFILAVAGPSSISFWNGFTGASLGEAMMLDGSSPPIALHWWHSDTANCSPLVIVVHSNYEISLWSIPTPHCITRIRPELESSVIHTCWTGSRLISITAEERIQFHSFSHSIPIKSNASPIGTISPIKTINSPLKNINSPIKTTKNFAATFASPKSHIKHQISPVSKISPIKNNDAIGIFSPESRRLLFGHS